MNVPYRRHAVWCLLTGTDKDELGAALDDLSLPLLYAPDYERLHEDAEALPLSPGIRRRLARRAPWHADTSAYLHRLGFGEIYDYDLKKPDLSPHALECWGRCNQLLRNPVGRVAVEAALLTGLSTDEVANLASPSVGVPLAADMLDLYAQHYFDHGAMTKTDWREYLKRCADHPYVYVRYQTALLRPRAETLHLVGLPTKTQLSAFLHDILNTANFKFQRYAGQGTPLSDEQARKWAKLGIEAGVRADKLSDGDVTDFATALQATFDYVDEPVENITGEMLAKVKPDAVEEGGGTKAPPPAVLQSEPEPY